MWGEPTWLVWRLTVISPHLTSLPDPHWGTACLSTAQCQVSSQPKSAHSARNQLARQDSAQHSCRKGQFSGSTGPQVHTGGTLNIASLWSAVVWGGQERHYNIRMAWFLGSCHKVQHQLLTVNWSRLVAQLWTGYDILQSPLMTAPSPSLCPLNPPACRIYFSLQSWASPGRALIVTKYYSNLPQGSMKWSYWDS